MKRPILLRIDAWGISAWTWQHGDLTVQAEFPDQTDGHAAFVDFLARQRNGAYRLFADLAAETLHCIEIPRLGRRDRAALIARRLARQFPDTPLRCARPLAHDAGHGGSEPLLLQAIADPKPLKHWLDALSAAGVQIPRLHTTSELAASLVAQVAPGTPAMLTVLCHRRYLRISGIAAGLPRCSRHLPASDDPTPALIDEAWQQRRYLLEQRLHDPRQPLLVIVVAPPEMLKHLADRWPAGGELELRPIAAADSRRLELQLLASHPRGGIPLGTTRRGWLLARLDGLLLAASAATLAAALGFAGLRMLQVRQFDAQAHELEAAVAAFPPTSASTEPAPLNAATLQRLHEGQIAYERQRRLPTESYRTLSRQLDRLPAIHLARLDWKNLPEAESTADAADTESLTVRGRLSGPATQFEELLAGLRREPATEIIVRQVPKDSGDAPDSEFVVEIRRSLAP